MQKLRLTGLDISHVKKVTKYSIEGGHIGIEMAVTYQIAGNNYIFY
jgi:hypothetical protein